MSTDLSTKIDLGLEELATVREQMSPLIAREWDGSMPPSDRWHRALLNQMAAPAHTRPPVIAADLVETLKEFLAFRHLFCGASIALMRCDKLAPLVATVDQTYLQARQELEGFQTFLQSRSHPAP